MADYILFTRSSPRRLGAEARGLSVRPHSRASVLRRVVGSGPEGPRCSRQGRDTVRNGAILGPVSKTGQAESRSKLMETLRRPNGKRRFPKP